MPLRLLYRSRWNGFAPAHFHILSHIITVCLRVCVYAHMYVYVSALMFGSMKQINILVAFTPAFTLPFVTLIHFLWIHENRERRTQSNTTNLCLALFFRKRTRPNDIIRLWKAGCQPSSNYYIRTFSSIKNFVLYHTAILCSTRNILLSKMIESRVMKLINKWQNIDEYYYSIVANFKFKTNKIFIANETSFIGEWTILWWKLNRQQRYFDCLHLHVNICYILSKNDLILLDLSRQMP